MALSFEEIKQKPHERPITEASWRQSPSTSFDIILR